MIGNVVLKAVPICVSPPNSSLVPPLDNETTAPPVPGVGNSTVGGDGYSAEEVQCMVGVAMACTMVVGFIQV